MTKNQARREKFQRIAAEASRSDAITTNDANWRSAITPNPWRGLKSSGSEDRTDEPVRGGPTVMQIDTRPGLCRKEHPE